MWLELLIRVCQVVACSICLFGYFNQKSIWKPISFDHKRRWNHWPSFMKGLVWSAIQYFVLRKFIVHLFCAQGKRSSHFLTCEAVKVSIIHEATFFWSSLILISHWSRSGGVCLYYLNVLSGKHWHFWVGEVGFIKRITNFFTVIYCLRISFHFIL